MSQLYSHHEVQEILNLAIARQSNGGDLTRRQLLEIGEEMGLTAQDVQRAEDEWRSLDTESKERKMFRHYRHLQVRHHAIKYVIVNGFFLALNYITTGLWVFPWSLWVALLWGMFLALDGWSAMQTEGIRFERRFQRWRQRRWLQRSVRQIAGRFFNAT
jgi:hypothetical protein